MLQSSKHKNTQENEFDEPEQVALSAKIQTKVVDVDGIGDGGISYSPEMTVTTENGTRVQASTLGSALGRRKYLSGHDIGRQMRATKEAASKDCYLLKEAIARGAESVLYRGVSGAYTYCAKAIRNGLNKWLGVKTRNTMGEKLDNVPYKTKVRHLENEFAIAKRLSEDGPMPIVRIYALRKVKRFGIELGYDLLMEFLNGHDLGDKVLLKGLPVEDKIRVFYQAVEALAFVHRKRVVHMDIKPSNFMLVNGRVKLIDFGVSVLSGYHAQAVTGTGGYLSPEQLCRDVVDERTDIFALGVTFAVFFGGKSLQQPQDKLLTRQAREEAKYHMTNTDTSAIVDVPELNSMPLLADVIRNCTIMRRDRRTKSCTALMSQLREAAAQYGIILN